MSSHRQTTAAILAGGRSKRMGSSDKALLPIVPGGPTLIEAVVTRLNSAGIPPTLIVTNTPQNYSFLGIAMAPDDIPGAGALGGILTALSHSPHPYASTLVVACDMPLLSPALLRYMASLPHQQDAIVPRWIDAERRAQVESLHAIYATSCVEPMRRRIAQGLLKVSDFLADINVRYLDEDVLRSYDPQLHSFRNINTPEQLQAMREVFLPL